MGIDRIVYIIAAIFGLDYRICTPTRDMQAEGALTRALARNGGDGLTACNPDAGACPKPCLRHRRVNVGIWPNWRAVAWRRSIHMLDTCPSRHEYEIDRCQDFSAHLDREARKLRIASYVQSMAKQGWAYEPHETPPIFWSNGPTGETVDLVTVFNHQAEGLLRQARNIAQNMGISPLWNREPNIIEPPDTTWYAQYPEQVWNERSEPQWTVSSPAPRPLEGRTYRFDPVSFTVPPPAESPQPSASLAPPSPASSSLQPAPDSEV